jgi:hypothetical protein
VQRGLSDRLVDGRIQPEIIGGDNQKLAAHRSINLGRIRIAGTSFALYLEKVR